MKPRRVRIEIEFALPGDCGGMLHSLEDCMGLVMLQMRAEPKWADPCGTGALNDVRFDRTLAVVSAQILEPRATP